MNDQEGEGRGPGAGGGDDAGGAGEKVVADEVTEAQIEVGDKLEDVGGKEALDNTEQKEKELPPEASGSQGVSQATRRRRRGGTDIIGNQKDDVKNLLRRLSKSEDSEGSIDGSASSGSFDDSVLNRRSIKTLQSAVIRDHEIPMKIAYEQLEELAANAEKVKYAIEKNRNLLNVQVKRSNARYLRAAFTAWKLHLEWQNTKRRDLEWAKGRWKRSLLSKAFKVWIREHWITGKIKRLEKSVKRKLGVLTQGREYKKMKTAGRMSNQSHDVPTATGDPQTATEVEADANVSRLERRSVKNCGHENLSPESRTRQRSRSLQSTFTAWKSVKDEEVRASTGRGFTTDDLYRKHGKNIAALAFAAWKGTVSNRKQGEECLKRVRLSLDKQLLARAFDAFVNGCYESKRLHAREKRALVKINNRKLKKYFDAWVCFMQVQAQKKMIRLQEHIVQMEKENDRVRQENQRLSHVIDSGDWGRKRIEELLQAGQILSGERDALTRLLGRMQRQHGFALSRQKVHEEEMQELKHQILRNKPQMRNKLLVKGASSFNSLIKAMKEDVLKNGTDPELLYTIDKLAMDEVTIFPDGDLRVKNMTNFDKGKGSWPARQGSPGPQMSEDIMKAIGQTRRAATPTRTRERPKTPLRNVTTRQEAPPTADSAKYPRPKTPIKGRAFPRFDFTQRLVHTTNQPAPSRVTDGDRNVLVKGAGYKREVFPEQTA